MPKPVRLGVSLAEDQDKIAAEVWGTEIREKTLIMKIEMRKHQDRQEIVSVAER